MFIKHLKYLRKKCKDINIPFKDFKKRYSKTDDQLTGPQDLASLFKTKLENHVEVKMKKLFVTIFNKILRKEYIIESLRAGKMQ